MTAPLREQLQIARINRVKRRLHDWWHRERCEPCQQKQALFAALSASVQRMPEFEPLPGEHSTLPKAH